MLSRRRFAWLLAALAVGPLPAALAQTALDPQSLLGEWVGKYVMTGGRARSGGQGAYSLTIKRVEGERVYATLGIGGETHDIALSLSGNRLTFASAQFRTEFVVEGKEMRGERVSLTGGLPAEIRLTKK